jgi:hypothetical protein
MAAAGAVHVRADRERRGRGIRFPAMTQTTDAALQDELFAIEEGFWTGGEEHFRALVDDLWMLFLPTMPDFHGVHSRA